MLPRTSYHRFAIRPHHLRQQQAPPQPPVAVALSPPPRRKVSRWRFQYPSQRLRSLEKLPPQPILSPARQPTPLLSQAPRRPPRPQVLEPARSAPEKWYVTAPEVSVTSSPCTSHSPLSCDESSELYEAPEDTTCVGHVVLPDDYMIADLFAQMRQQPQYDHMRHLGITPHPMHRKLHMPHPNCTKWARAYPERCLQIHDWNAHCTFDYVEPEPVAIAKPVDMPRPRKVEKEYPTPDEEDYSGFIITYDTATSINIVSSPKFSPVKLGPGFDTTVVPDSPGWSPSAPKPSKPASFTRGSGEDSSISLNLSSGLMKLAGMFFKANSDNSVSTSHSRSEREALARDSEKNGWLKASRQHLLSPVVDFCQRTWNNIFDTLTL